MHCRIGHVLAGVAATIAMAGTALATPASQSAGPTSPAETWADVRTRSIEAYQVRRGLKARTAAALAARQRRESLPPGLAAVVPITGTAVAGRVEVPIVMLLFANTPAAPFPAADLQQELFDGPWPSGTMTEHYREMSDGLFEVDGEVLDWQKLPGSDAFYAGPCNGLCTDAKIDEMLTAALALVDNSLDFRRFDNDGPDNRPNSGDDDGFVDFVAFVHPESGGECGGGSDNIWSHRFSLAGWGSGSHATGDTGQQGAPILVDDYVIMPAMACDGSTMIQIGVFSHEFGHAFGLPDLYDSEDPTESAGLGGWDLMASGSWGGDGFNASDAPAHMSGWAKEFLGWVTPRVIEADQEQVQLAPVIGSGDVVRVDYAEAADPADTRYLLLEYRTRQGFDRSLQNDGLLVTEVNNTRVQAGLQDNSVNGRPLDMGVNVIEADGLRELDRDVNRADAGDVFPGSANALRVDATHAEPIGAALCNIQQTPSHITLDIFTERTVCPEALAAAAVPPAEAVGGQVMRGAEVVVEGVLINEGNNYFTDRRLVVKGEGPEGGEILVTTPLPLETALPATAPGAPTAAVAPQDPTAAPRDLSDVLGKKVLVRGHVQRAMQKGVGMTDVLVIEELELAQ